MLVVQKEILDSYIGRRCVVYSVVPLTEGVECYPSNKYVKELDEYFVSTINVTNIRHECGRFYFTNEDLSIYDNFFGQHVLPVVGSFVSSNKKKSGNRGSTVNNKLLKHYVNGVRPVKGANKKVFKISTPGFITDLSALPAFNTDSAYEDVKVFEYRFYNTLFNNFSIKECLYERHKLFDAKFMSSKFDLENKMQNSDFLKSKDFTIINVLRKDNESVQIGFIVKESEDNYTYEYGKVYIDMCNNVYVKWH